MVINSQVASNNDPLPDLPAAKPDFLDTSLEPVYPIPEEVRPTLAKFRSVGLIDRPHVSTWMFTPVGLDSRIDVLFWGLRELRRVHWSAVERPRVDIEVGGKVLMSDVIPSAKRGLNFPNPIKSMEVVRTIPNLSLAAGRTMLRPREWASPNAGQANQQNLQIDLLSIANRAFTRDVTERETRTPAMLEYN